MNIGWVIIQNGNHFSFYSCKLTPAQINDKNIERELLSIVETLEWFPCNYIRKQYNSIYGPQ